MATTDSDLIKALYSGIGDPDDWSYVLQTLSEATGASSGNILATDLRDSSGSVSCFHGIDPEWIQAYNDYYYEFDPSPALLRTHPNTVHVDHVTGPKLTELKGDRRTFYNELMEPQDFRHTLALGVSGIDDWSGGLILQRTRGAGAFEPRMVKRLQRFSEHFSKRLQIHARLSRSDAMHSSMGNALNNMPVAVLFLDARHRPVFINRAAETILGTSRILSVGIRGLTTPSTIASRKLDALVRKHSDAGLYGESGLGSGKLWLVDHDGGQDLHIEITPMITGKTGDPFSNLHAVAAVWLTTLQHRQPPSAERLRETYGLTSAEADILARLVEGNSIPEIARSRSVMQETIRSQLKALMKKMHTRRQADLVRLVLTGPVGSRTDP